MNAGHVLPRPDISLSAIETWCRLADVVPCDFFSVDEVVQILDAGGYGVSEAVIAEYARLGYIQPPPQKDRWPAIALHQLGIALEQRRRWKVSPSCHDHKKCAAELLAEQKPGEFIREAETITLEDLILLLYQTGHPKEKDFVFVLARAKLALLGIKGG